MIETPTTPLKWRPETGANGPAAPELCLEEHPYPLRAAVEWISVEQAREWLSSATYDRQRDVSDWHVSRLAAAIRAGHYSEQGITLADEGGRRRLVNGQHRLLAIIAAGQGVREVVIRKTLSPAGVADEYGRTDVGRQRGAADNLRAHAIGQDEGLTPPEIAMVSVGAYLIQMDFTQHRDPSAALRLGLGDPDRRLAVLRDWLPEGSAYAKLIRDAQRGRVKFLRLQGTAAVAMVGLRYEPEQAREFWELAAHARGREFGDPVAALLSLFAKPMGKRGKAPEWARLVATCWNAWMEKRELTAPWNTRRTGAIRIAGSPWNGVSADEEDR